MGFLSNLVGFENVFSKGITEDVLHNPTRLLTGIDPASTKVWNTVLGRDDKPLVNVYGSPGQQYYDQAQAEGIDTGAAQKFHAIADKVASYYGMQGLNNIGGGAAGAGSGSGGNGMGFMDMFSGGGGGGSGWGSLLGGILGAVDSHNQPNSEVTQNKIDPRIDQILFGSNNDGLLARYQSLLNTPQAAAAQNFSSANADYLTKFGAQGLSGINDAANTLMSRGISAPLVGAAQMGAVGAGIPSYAVGNKVQAPAQNNMDLTGTFNNLLNGGNNTALRDSLKFGTDLTNTQFQKNQTDLTNNLMRNVMPGIRSNAVLAGQYGGSRQGVAEGNAISDYTNQLTNANTQIGLANSANTTAQLANDYQQGQNRSLAAAQGLSAQQYATAMQNANTANQAEFMNVGNQFDMSKYNAGLAQQTGLVNTGAQNTANLANQSATLQTNALNNAGLISGAGLMGGLLSQANGGLSSATGYAQGVNSLIAPYLSANQSVSTPLYKNTAGSVVGGAMLGSQLGGLFSSWGNNSGSVDNTLF